MANCEVGGLHLFIGADIVPTRSNASLFASGELDSLLGSELLQLLRQADLNIFNLEVPLTDCAAPIPKCGPCLIAGTETVSAYQKMPAHFLTLANNHILDQGAQGLASTMQTLDAAGIAYAGAGHARAEARKPWIRQIGDQKIGIYCCAEHEFSIAPENCPGANPFDALESFDDVASLRKDCDYLIVLYHGGKEHYRYPSPNLQKICRKFVRAGANLVVCQHSHCVGCKEDYQDGTIVYGQGNFLFDDSDSEFWQTSLLLSVNDRSVSYLPLVKRKNTVRLAHGQDAEAILRGFEERSAQILDEAFVREAYARFSQQLLSLYLGTFTQKRHRLLFRVLNKLTRGKWSARLPERLPMKYKLAVLNFVECEAHREALIAALRNTYQ